METKNQKEVNQLLYFAATAAYDYNDILRKGLSELAPKRIELKKTSAGISAYDADIREFRRKIGILKTSEPFASIFSAKKSVIVDAIKRSGYEDGRYFAYVEVFWIENGEEIGRRTLTAVEHAAQPKKYRSRGIGRHWVESIRIKKDDAFLKLAE